MENEILKESEVAEMLRVSPDTMLDMRKKGNAPAYFFAGKRVRYYKADVEEWIEKQRAVSKKGVQDAS